MVADVPRSALNLTRTRHTKETMTEEEQERRRAKPKWLWFSLAAVVALLAVIIVPPLVSVSRYKRHQRRQDGSRHAPSTVSATGGNQLPHPLQARRRKTSLLAHRCRSLLLAIKARRVAFETARSAGANRRQHQLGRHRN